MRFIKLCAMQPNQHGSDQLTPRPSITYRAKEREVNLLLLHFSWPDTKYRTMSISRYRVLIWYWTFFVYIYNYAAVIFSLVISLEERNRTFSKEIQKTKWDEQWTILRAAFSGCVCACASGSRDKAMLIFRTLNCITCHIVTDIPPGILNPHWIGSVHPNQNCPKNK